MWENNVKIKFFITLEINQSCNNPRSFYARKKMHNPWDILINIKLYVLIGPIIWYINYIVINMCVFYKKWKQIVIWYKHTL